MIRKTKIKDSCPVYLCGPIESITLPKQAKEKKDYQIISDTEIRMTMELFGACQIDTNKYKIYLSLRIGIVVCEDLWNRVI